MRSWSARARRAAARASASRASSISCAERSPEAVLAAGPAGAAGGTTSVRTGVVVAGSLARTSSSFMPFISPLKIRSDRPIEREASGSFLYPKSSRTARMIRMISGAPSFIGSSGGERTRRCYAAPLRSLLLRCLPAGRSAALGPPLGGLRRPRQRLLHLPQDRPELPLEALHLAGQPAEGAQQAVHQTAEDDQHDHGDRDPHDQQHHGGRP